MSAVWQAQPLAAPQRQALEPLLRENWGGPLIASRGRLWTPPAARPVVGKRTGWWDTSSTTQRGTRWEVALLEALEQGRGVGSALLGPWKRWPAGVAASACGW